MSKHDRKWYVNTQTKTMVMAKSMITVCKEHGFGDWTPTKPAPALSYMCQGFKQFEASDCK